MQDRGGGFCNDWLFVPSSCTGPLSSRGLLNPQESSYLAHNSNVNNSRDLYLLELLNEGSGRLVVLPTLISGVLVDSIVCSQDPVGARTRAGSHPAGTGKTTAPLLSHLPKHLE